MPGSEASIEGTLEGIVSSIFSLLTTEMLFDISFMLCSLLWTVTTISFSFCSFALRSAAQTMLKDKALFFIVFSLIILKSDIIAKVRIDFNTFFIKKDIFCY